MTLSDARPRASPPAHRAEPVARPLNRAVLSRLLGSGPDKGLGNGPGDRPNKGRGNGPDKGRGNEPDKGRGSEPEAGLHPRRNPRPRRLLSWAVLRRGVLSGRGLAVGDQVLSAAQNFALMSIAARQLSPVAFGYFALALTVCWLLFGVNLAIVTEPLLVRSGTVRRGRWPRLIGSAIAFTAATSGALGVCCALAAFLAPAPMRASLLVVGVILPVLGVFETVRTAALARLRQGVALAMDGAWVLLWLTTLLVLRPGTVAGQLLVWGLTSLGGLAVYLLWHRSELGSLQRGLRSSSYQEFSQGLKRLYLFEYLTTGGLAHLFTMGMSGVVGVAAVGGYRAAQAVTGPVNTVLNALRMVVVPVFSRAAEGSPRPNRPGRGGLPQSYPMALSAGLVVVVLGMTGLLLLVPDSVGTALFGLTWADAAPLVLAVSLQRAAAGALTGPVTALRVCDAAGRTVRLRVIAAVVGYVIALAVGLRFGLQPALWALVLISAVEACVAWWIWLRFDNNSNNHRNDNDAGRRGRRSAR